MNDKDTYRMHTKVIQIGDRKIGGGNPIAIQSMTNTKTEDVKATVEQILRLEKAGCEIIRCTVPTLEAAAAIREIILTTVWLWLPSRTVRTRYVSTPAISEVRSG